MSDIEWTAAGDILRSIPQAERDVRVGGASYAIRDVSTPCSTCDGTGMVGPLVETWLVCAGYDGDDGWVPCPDENPESTGPIVYRFETPDGGDFPACPNCGPRFPGGAVQREKIGAQMQRAVCPDCRTVHGVASGRRPMFALCLVRPSGEDVVARSPTKMGIQIAFRAIATTAALNVYDIATGVVTRP